MTTPREEALRDALLIGDMRAALRDMLGLMPADRYRLLRPSTLALLDEVLPDESVTKSTNAVRGRVTNRRLDMRLKENRR